MLQWSIWSLQGMGSWAHSPAPSQGQRLDHLAPCPVLLELDTVFLELDTVPGHCF